MLAYSGNETQARPILRKAIDAGDKADARDAIKNIRLSCEMKEEASKLFKRGEV